MNKINKIIIGVFVILGFLAIPAQAQLLRWNRQVSASDSTTILYRDVGGLNYNVSEGRYTTYPDYGYSTTISYREEYLDETTQAYYGLQYWGYQEYYSANYCEGHVFGLDTNGNYWEETYYDGINPSPASSTCADITTSASGVTWHFNSSWDEEFSTGVDGVDLTVILDSAGLSFQVYRGEFVGEIYLNYEPPISGCYFSRFYTANPIDP